MQPRPIRFHFRGRVVQVDGVAPTLSVLDWLRTHAAAHGTKEGCAEGDCGACTVVLGDLTDDGKLALQTVNACLQFLPMLDGRALFTVEDLKTIAGGRLHPVQQALVDHHGSQCGFCTPGFAMSLFGEYEQHRDGARPTRQALADALAGNLCRCTGYRPILDAAEQMFDAPAAALDTAPIVAALRELRATDEEVFVYEGPNPALHVDGRPRIDRFVAPHSLAAFARLRDERPQARLLAGATDIGLWVNKQFRDLGEILYIGAVPELQRIECVSDGLLRIGAGVSLERAWAALVERAPELREVALRFASPPVRHAGTLAGNLANGSPIGDGAPILMALNARLVLRQGEGAQRRIALDAFYVDYMKNRLAPGEFIEAIEVPALPAAMRLRAYKISKRYDSDISAVCAGLALMLDAAGVVREARFAYGGMAAIVKRAALAEQAVLGRVWNEAAAHAAMAALGEDFQPLSDMRARADHRLRTARNLLLRFWLETRLDAPLPEAQTRVWSQTPATAAHGEALR